MSKYIIIVNHRSLPSEKVILSRLAGGRVLPESVSWAICERDPDGYDGEFDEVEARIQDFSDTISDPEAHEFQIYKLVKVNAKVQLTKIVKAKIVNP